MSIDIFLQILHDFHFLYPGAKDLALVEQWERIEKKPQQLHKINVTDNDSIFHCDLQMHDFFAYLKLLSAHKVKFPVAVKSFVISSEVKIGIFVVNSILMNVLFLRTLVSIRWNFVTGIGKIHSLI